jgi:hypothetical protein
MDEREFRWVASVAANWRCSGSSGHDDPPDAPVLSSYTRRATDDHPLNRHVKTIVFPAMTSTWVEHPHHFR